MLKVNKKTNYKLLIKKDTPRGIHLDYMHQKFILKKYKKLKFMKLDKSIEKYFMWINKLPKRSI